MEVLAIIPARGGSKGLAGKNLRTIGGRSLTAWAVQAALNATSVGRVVGSTDDEAIAAEFRRSGAEVPFLRPATLAGDDVEDAPVFLHALEVLSTEGYEPDIVVNVRPTAPLRTASDIDAAVNVLQSTASARSVKSVSEVSEHPYKMWTVPDTETQLLKPLLPEWLAAHGGNPDVPRHWLGTVYRSSGAVDAVWAMVLKETGMFHPGPVVAHVIEPARDIDIDTLADLQRAEALLTGQR